MFRARQKLIWILAFFILLVGGISIPTVTYFLDKDDSKDAQVKLEEAVTLNDNLEQVEIKITSSQDESLTLTAEFVTGENMLEVLKNLDKERDDFIFEFKDWGGSLGAGPIAFNDYRIDEANEWWKFMVNNQMSDVGISSYELKAGDDIEFIREKF